MLRKRFCELFEIDAPVLQAAICPATAPELVAAVSGDRAANCSRSLSGA
jgi:NAD(P)H-dependent flavin oxidoreductase YrpB (nitropropane dioxygenase family)